MLSQPYRHVWTAEEQLERWAWEVLSVTPLDSRAGKGFPVQGPSSIGAQMVGKCVSPQPQSRAVSRPLL